MKEISNFFIEKKKEKPKKYVTKFIFKKKSKNFYHWQVLRCLLLKTLVYLGATLNILARFNVDVSYLCAMCMSVLL
jgi:hypothetical protein